MVIGALQSEYRVDIGLDEHSARPNETERVHDAPDSREHLTLARIRLMYGYWDL